MTGPDAMNPAEKLAQRVRELEAKLADSEARAAAMRDLLKKLEWSQADTDGEACICPMCFSCWQGFGHSELCEFKAALSGEAGKQLAERHAELVEWAEKVNLLPLNASFCDIPKPPEWPK